MGEDSRDRLRLGNASVTSPAMRFAILGPLRVEGPGGAIELKAAKQRALLAMLLLSDRDEAVRSTG